MNGPPVKLRHTYLSTINIIYLIKEEDCNTSAKVGRVDYKAC